MMEQLLQQLNIKLQTRYIKELEKLNSAIQPAAITTLNDGSKGFNIPTIVVEGEGVSSPARVNIQFSSVPQLLNKVSIIISASELEICNKNQSYFNYLFDTVLRQGISNFAKNFGPSDSFMFGSNYISFTLEEVEGDIHLVLLGCLAKVS